MTAQPKRYIPEEAYLEFEQTSPPCCGKILYYDSLAALVITPVQVSIDNPDFRGIIAIEHRYGGGRWQDCCPLYVRFLRSEAYAINANYMGGK